MYGAVLLLTGVAYYILERVIIAARGPGCRLEAAVGKDTKGKASVVMYAIAIPLAFDREASELRQREREQNEQRADCYFAGTSRPYGSP